MVRATAMFALLWLTACAPAIGDSCQTGLDCSVQATRLCDQTQPSGYCTLPGCDRGTCPDEAVCVRFRPDTPRLSSSFCMLACEDDGDCRTGDGYACLSDRTFGPQPAEGTAARPAEARVLDGNRKFCAVPASQDLDSSSDAGTVDAGTVDAGTVDAGTVDAGIDGGA